MAITNNHDKVSVRNIRYQSKYIYRLVNVWLATYFKTQMPDIYVYLYILHITYYILILHINIDINIPAIKMLSTPTVSVSTIQPIGMR